MKRWSEFWWGRAKICSLQLNTHTCTHTHRCSHTHIINKKIDYYLWVIADLLSNTKAAPQSALLQLLCWQKYNLFFSSSEKRKALWCKTGGQCLPHFLQFFPLPLWWMNWHKRKFKVNWFATKGLVGTRRIQLYANEYGVISCSATYSPHIPPRLAICVINRWLYTALICILNGAICTGGAF